MNKQKLNKLQSFLFVVILCFSITQFIYCPDDPGPVTPEEPIILNITIPKVENCNVKIISPPNKSTLIASSASIEGTILGLPTGYSVRVFVNPKLVGRWYPQQPAIMFSDSTWEATAYIGDGKSAGQQFVIGAYVVSQTQANEIDKDLSGRTQYIISGQVPATAEVTLQ